MNDDAQLHELRMYTKHQLASMVLDLREKLRMPQDRQSVLDVGIIVMVFAAGLVVGWFLP